MTFCFSMNLPKCAVITRILTVNKSFIILFYGTNHRRNGSRRNGSRQNGSDPKIQPVPESSHSLTGVFFL